VTSPSRKERREQARAEARAGKRALPLVPDTPSRQALRLRYAAALEAGEPPSRLVDDAHAEGDARASRVFARVGSPACRAGCSYCCHLFVSVRADEARRLAATLRAFPADRLAEVRGRLAASAGRTASDPVLPRRACSLLAADGTCVAYDARPFSCRQYHSFDVEACRKVDAGEADAVPSHREAFAVQIEVLQAWLEATASRGGDTESYGLEHALRILLDDPGGDLAPAREQGDGRA
jgi:Fe-S-cluster containining protein